MMFPDAAIYVKEGDIPIGTYAIQDSLMVSMEVTLPLNEIYSCTVVSDRHETYQTGTGRIAGGIIGAVLLGPLGAAGGLLAGGKRRFDETIILCRLCDGRTFSAQCTPLTAAKLSQIASANHLSKSIALSQEKNADPVSSNSSLDLADTTECPMCAEIIKIRAKICRYCGCQVQEEKNKEIKNLMTDDVEEVHVFDDLYQNYVANTEAEDFFDRKSALEIMTSFSRLQAIHPGESYRDLADMIRDEYGGNTKQPIYDLIKYGFKFLRKNKKFDIVDGRYLLVKR